MNSGAGDYYMPHVQCLGDVTKKLGYYNAFYQGGSLGFTRKGAFFNAHGYHEVKGINELWKDVPRNRRSNWGLHDDALFDFAKQRIGELASNAKTQPFLFTLLTLDTHDPFGSHKTSLTCNRLGANVYSAQEDHVITNQVHCSDMLVGKFVQELRDKYSETIDIYLVADHLAHAHSQGERLKNIEERDLIFISLNDHKKHKVDRDFTHLDIAPTILDHSTGGFIRKMGLGVSLLRPKKTLLEKFGTAEFNAKIQDNLSTLAERYWNYPALEGSPFTFDQKSFEFRFAGTSFPSPILFKLNDDNEINSYYSTSIAEHLKVSTDVGRVVSVQKCGALTKYQPNSYPESSFCLMIGNLGAESLHVEAIESGKEYSLENYSKYLESESSNARLRSRLFESVSNSSKLVSSASSKHISPLADAHFIAGPRSTSKMVTNYWDLSLFDKFENFQNHKAAEQDGLYFFKINSGRVDLLNIWTSCDDLKRDNIKSVMTNSNATEFVLMSGRHGLECQDYESDTPFDNQITALRKGQSLIAYLNLETAYYKPLKNENGESIQLNLVDEKVYSHYQD